MDLKDKLEITERPDAPCRSLPEPARRPAWRGEQASRRKAKHARRAATYSIIAPLLLFMVVAAVTPTPSFAVDIGISIRVGPPPLPVYDQPLCPGPGYIWTPGYWAYDPTDGYYWVPGTWVEPPEPGLLWTPGYWGWSDGLFSWHAGYWGPHVGFYGGVDYGFGYTGSGYEGGYWRGREFFYNRSVNNVNVTKVTNVYNRTVVNNVNVTRVSYNGGPNGLKARPTSGEMAAEHERHVAATSPQLHQRSLARQDRSQFASVNHGKPTVMASARPGDFHGGNVARPAPRQGETPHGAAHLPSSNARVEHSKPGSGQGAAPRGEARVPNSKPRVEHSKLGSGQGATPRAETRMPNSNPRVEHASPGGGTAHPRAATPAPNRSAERPEGKTPSAEPRQTHEQSSHAAPARRPENASRPQARPEARKASPPAERKPQGREH